MSVLIYHFFPKSNPQVLHQIRCDLFDTIAALGDCDQKNIEIIKHIKGETKVFTIIGNTEMCFDISRTPSDADQNIDGYIYTFKLRFADPSKLDESLALCIFQSFNGWNGDNNTESNG